MTGKKSRELKLYGQVLKQRSRARWYHDVAETTRGEARQNALRLSEDAMSKMWELEALRLIDAQVEG